MEINENRVSTFLRQFGMPCSMLGFVYAKEAIMLIATSEEYRTITKTLYPAVAIKYNTTCSRVERAMRHSIAKAFSNAKVKAIEEAFGNGYSHERGVPTNKEFLYGAVEYLRGCKEV